MPSSDCNNKRVASGRGEE
ncbi:hypothetical protein YPPY59_0703, partial [Yersinia pestis PY-59]